MLVRSLSSRFGWQRFFSLSPSRSLSLSSSSSSFPLLHPSRQILQQQKLPLSSLIHRFPQSAPRVASFLLFSSQTFKAQRWATNFRSQPPPPPRPPKSPPSSPISSEEGYDESPEIIFEVTRENFRSDVAQSPVPVFLECYAPHAEAKEMSEALQRAVLDAEGALRLARLNVETIPELTEQLRITHLPTILALWQGRLLGSLVGVQPSQTVLDFVNNLLKKGGMQSVTAYLEEADKLLKANDPGAAAQVFSELLQKKNLKGEAQALAGLARCALAENDPEIAKQLIQQIRDNFPNEISHPYVRQAVAAIELLGQASQKDVSPLLAAIEANPEDLQARYDLALARFQTGAHEEALAQCFEIIKRDRAWQDKSARNLVLKIFDALGPKDPITIKGRKRLANLLF